MCIRFEGSSGRLLAFSKPLRQWIPDEDWREGKDTFPGYVSPIIRADAKQGDFEEFAAQMGLQPFWAKTKGWGKSNAYNARSETIFEKPAFRNAIKSRRCLIPATAFYERQKLDDGTYWMRAHQRDGEVFTMAGIWEGPTKLVEAPRLRS